MQVSEQVLEVLKVTLSTCHSSVHTLMCSRKLNERWSFCDRDGQFYRGICLYSQEVWCFDETGVLNGSPAPAMFVYPNMKIWLSSSEVAWLRTASESPSACRATSLTSESGILTKTPKLTHIGTPILFWYLWDGEVHGKFSGKRSMRRIAIQANLSCHHN